MKTVRRLALLAASLAAASAWAADPIRMDVRTTFDGPASDTNAVTVTLENDGPDAHGTLRVLGAENGTIYPVSLPRGESRTVLTLNGISNWGTLRFVLDTDQGRAVQEMPAVWRENGRNLDGSALFVGDDNRSVAFLRPEGDQSVGLKDAYVRPARAPDRAAAYRGFNAVFLSPAAIGIGNDAVRALKEYALGGGTLVFLGGSNPELLEDARWADVLPGRGWRSRRVSPRPLDGLGTQVPPGGFTVVEPKELAPGAAALKGPGGASIFDTERGFGLGRVVALGYSPFEGSLQGWEGRTRLLARFIRGGSSINGAAFLDAYTGQTVSGGSSGVGDPFSTKLPPAATVFGILVGYFVLVVPVSFLVLRKLKRGELAWITAPLLSLGFAGLLFRSASGLYSSALSTASQGVVVLQQGQPDAMFYGTSQMFFPKGGVYDLRLKGVDHLDTVRGASDYGSDALAGFNPVDSGVVEVPRLESNNLAFREMSYVQRVKAGDWFRIEPLNAVYTRVENRSRYPFNGYLFRGRRQSAPLSLRPGETKIIDAGRSQTLKSGETWSATSAHRFTDGSGQGDGRIALSGTITGFRPGPQIGSEVRNSVTVIAFAGENAR